MSHILVLFFLFFIYAFPALPQQVDGPVFLGRPPQNAYTGLVKLDNGEIRHYGKNLYIRSIDDGQTWDTVNVEDGNLYGKKYPDDGEYLRLFAGADDAVFSARSVGGIDGQWITEKIDSNGAIMLKPAIFIREGKRAIVGFHTNKRNGSGCYYSDDGGHSWQKSNQVNAPDHHAGGFHQGPRWNHGAVEPSIIELNDGRLWMIMRTAQDYHYESYSEDGGETWLEAVPSRFYGTITMPTIQRLSNGKILILWCNTTPLPERDHDFGYWEDVFTNRDAIHAAISDDDGQSWVGFREIYLNPLRNDSLMATKFGKQGSLDRSVHQSEFVELDEHTVLISLGQHPEFRALLKLDTRWLYEKEHKDDFSDGLENWSVQKYRKGIEGHCAYNRKAGAKLVVHDDNPSRNIMHLYANRDTSLLHQNAGAVFNFPSGFAGELKIKMKFNHGFGGMAISLQDRWFNPVDTLTGYYAMYQLEIPPSLTLDQQGLSTRNWYTLKFVWKNVNRKKSGFCDLYVGDIKIMSLPMLNKTENGISYIHLNLPAGDNINEGIFIDGIHVKVE